MPHRRVAFMVLAAAFFAAALVGACAREPEESPPEPALTDVEIGIKVDKIIADYLESLDLDSRETIFKAQDSVSQGTVTLRGDTSDESLKKGLLDMVAQIPGITVVDELRVLPPPSMGEKVFGVVKVPVVNLGDGPRSSGGSHTVTQARMGDILKLLKENDGWFLGQMDDGYLGWVGPESVHLVSREEVEAMKKSRVALVTAKTASVLREPGGDSLFIQALVQGSVLPLVGEEGDWVQVRVPGGPEGWIEASKTQAYESMDAVFGERKGAEGVIDTAKQYLGLPYLWGGTTAYGFDCSGLTQFAMKMNGYSIRRDADMQYEQGEVVADRADLRPGDLVFFETYRKGPSHVGIYIGDSQYIQSGGQTGITILSFDPAHSNYSETLDRAYLGGRRIIK
ncbi:MAG TPA: glycoside hydrolase [Firmicutes bacterium]|nr:glycoside hydrolase [Candidatus Fermentithermobacillaceae bacterium]